MDVDVVVVVVVVVESCERSRVKVCLPEELEGQKQSKRSSS